MNATHIHLLTNHIPIIGFACGLFVLIWGIFGKNKGAVSAALLLLAGSGIGGMIANKTGEDAEHAIERITGVNQTAMESHEEAAELAMPFIVATVVLSGAALFFNIRGHRFSPLSNYAVLISAIAGFIFSARAGSKGGEIRHSQELNLPAGAASSGEKGEHDE